MSIAECLMLKELYGLYKIDQAGVIQAFQSENDDYSKAMDSFIFGHNIFDEVLPFDNIAEFYRRIETFRASSAATESFRFDCKFYDRIVPVNVRFTRSRMSDISEKDQCIFLDIRKINPPNFKNKEQGNGNK